MSQQARYITNLERALTELLECFEENGKFRPMIEVITEEGIGPYEVTDATEDAITFANKVLYGDEALMEDEI